MKPSTDGHLTHDQIVRATVDLNDLPEDRRLHLKGCERCKQVLADMEGSLSRLGAQVCLHTPVPHRPVRIDHGMKRASSTRFGWSAGLSTAVVAFITVAIVWMTMDGRVRPDSRLADIVDDNAFMEEVARLVEDPLPDRYRNLIDADAGYLEGDFMEFIVPAVKRQPPEIRR